MTGRAQGYLAATACVLGFGACSTPDERSDLRPSGPPEVLVVLASNDAAGDGILEGATFCKTNDPKRPGLVPANPDGPAQVCPDDLAQGAPGEVTDTVPVDWYVRIQFDELLNPDIEELLPIPDSDLVQGSLAKSQPVTLSCGGVNVAYDGYYDPSGNSLTWPLGPSLFIQPADTSTIATGTECQVSVKPDVVADKDGNHVPSDQLGPYKFKIAPLALVSQKPDQPADPAKPSTIAATTPLVLTFNATMGTDVKIPPSLDPAQVKIVDAADCMGGAPVTPHAASILLDPNNNTAIDIGDIPGDPNVKPAKSPTWMPGLTYIVTFPTGIDVKDSAGGAGHFLDGNKLTICFKTAP